MQMLLHELTRGALHPIRHLIDRVDDQLHWWMAARRRLVAAVAQARSRTHEGSVLARC